MTLGEKCKDEVLKKMKEKVELYEKMYDDFIKTGNCTGIKCEDCPFDSSGIGKQFTNVRCATVREVIMDEFNKEVD